MYRCLKCNKITDLPKCYHCGYAFRSINGIYQLTEDPNIKIEENDDVKYIGYDNIGAFYGGKRWYECDNASLALGKKLSELTGEGILLDLACGNGYFTVPAMIHNCKVIAGDISNTMLELLVEKAYRNNTNLEKLTPCRMNALSIPLDDNCIDVVIANGVLHLISKPEIVIDEVYRVLKPGGKLISISNSPLVSKKDEDRIQIYNEEASKIIKDFYNLYWQELKNYDLAPKKHSWKFDQVKSYKKKFGNEEIIDIDFYDEIIYKLSDWFIYRMKGKGFSDQQHINDKLHIETYKKVEEKIANKYGANFGETKSKNIITGLKMHLFIKK